ncbi:hypothetical protein FXE87_18950 [Vibrio mimicus]|nr:hypothetical protein FXE87_18950 [Vibrio mimicus]
MTRFDRFHGLMVLFTTLAKVFRLTVHHEKRRLKGRRWNKFSVSSLIFVQREIRRTVDKLLTSQQKYTVAAIFKL